MSDKVVQFTRDPIEGLTTAQANGLWTRAQQSGIGRRRFLHLLSLGGAAAVLAACTPIQPVATTPAAEAAEALPWFKDTTHLIERGSNLETRLENLHGLLTPNELFFVRNQSVSLDLDPASWRLIVEGDGVTTPLELTYEDLLNLPSRTIFSYLECAGNQRSLFDLVNGQPAEGTQWGTGAISNGEWTGVPLREVLNLAGILDDAVDVLLIGLDTESPEEGYRRALPVEKALDPDTLLAYTLNGATLPKDHGFPVRALTPGWIGASSVKWLGRIQVSREKLWTRANTTAYVLVGEDYPPEGEAEGKVVTTQAIKSALALPWPAEFTAGTHRVRGFAQTPIGRIEKVEWSADGGSTWNEATVLDPQIQYSWARFEFVWEAQPGEYTILTRATDVEGNTQPDQVPFNAQGYLFNQPVPHPVKVV